MLNIYKASAGSGKTFTLAREYIRLLLQTSAHDLRAHSHILAVTFTKKATAEMKERILSELFLLSTDPERSAYCQTFCQTLHLSPDQLQSLSRMRLFRLLQNYSHFSVSTIDGFFQQIVRSFARELGLPATYNLSLDSDEIIQEAVDDLLFATSRTTTGTEQLGPWLSNFAMQNIHDGRKWNPKDEIQSISAHLLTERLQARLNDIRPLLMNKQLLSQYRQQLEAILQQDKSVWYRKRKLDDAAQKQKRDYYTAEVILHNLDALGVISDVAAQIQHNNQEQNRLPLADINMLLNRVIDHSDTPFIYEKIGSRIHHYMIDEFQDTSTLQWENFRPLLSDSNASGQDNLIVGDTKQSIYRWRNSDWHLLEQVHHQIQPSQQPPMDTNFRSSATIVDTNNDIFRRYADWVSDQLDSETDDTTYGATVRGAYETLFQKARHSQLAGRYHIRFIEADKTSDANQQAMLRLLPILAELQERHIRMGDVAVLVRNRREAQTITRFLMDNGYDVQSAEGLLVSSHPAVQLLICLLTLSIRPTDDMTRTRLRLCMANHLCPDNGQAALELAMSDEPLFTDQQQALITRSEQLPLYAQIQTLIDGLDLTQWQNATPYLTTLLDIIYQYCENRIADTGSFLSYWERRQDKASIPSAPTDTAIRVMTIHKSKGLEFDVVLIPFLSWAAAAERMDSKKLLWVEPQQAPFDTLPLLPVTNAKALKNTIFQDDYARELRDLYIDNLNLTYVAFTRPRCELYAFGQMAPKTSKGEDSIQNIGHLLSVLLRDELTPVASEQYKDERIDEWIYERSTIGQLPGPKPKGELTNGVITRPAVYRSVEIGNRLRLRTRARADEDLSVREFGTLMHDILAEINTLSDADSVIARYIYTGRARQEDEPRIREVLAQFQQLIRDYDWFDSNRYRILSEQDILSPTGNTYRPDRIMISGSDAVVIDYKFGSEHQRQYREQVRTYMTLLDQMGYHTRGYLVYITLHKIEPV